MNDEELASGRIQWRVFSRHGNCASKVLEFGVDFEFEVCSRAFVAVSAGSVSFFEVSTLDHKVFNHSMEDRVFVFPGFRQFFEIFDCFGNFVFKKFDFYYSVIGRENGYFFTLFRHV